MYSREERVKAIELYIKYDRCAADVASELGYPDRKSLVSWYEAYLEEQDPSLLFFTCRAPNSSGGIRVIGCKLE
jgi:transposase-like protein